MTLQEMRDQRNKLVTEARQLHDAATKEKRSLNAEEQQKFDALMDDAAKAKRSIADAERLEAEERDLGESRGRQTDPGDAAGKKGGEDRNAARAVEYRGKPLEIPAGLAHRTSVAYAEAFGKWLRSEQRTAASFANDVDADGGYLHAPYQFVAELIKDLDNMVFVRRYARVLPLTTGDSLGIPTMPTRPADADWTAEVGAISADVTAQLGIRELKPQQLTKEIDVSMKLLQTAAISPEAIVREELASLFARTEEKAFLTGNGSAKPLGVFYASASGISTGRDIATSNTTTAITVDGLYAAKYGLTLSYRIGSRWLFHRDAVKMIATLKDSDGQYLWQPAKADDEPDRLLGLPVDESEYAPSTFTAGLYVGILANWKYYWIADMLALTIQRLNELLARNSKVGFIGRKYTDGAPVQENAFARVTLAAS